MTRSTAPAPAGPTIQFYLPYMRDGIKAIPGKPEEYWPWMLANPGIGEGKYTWTLQTYLYLRRAGADCTLVAQMPARGIVISHRDFLPVHLHPSGSVFLICIKADRNEHPWANFHFVQNEIDHLRQAPEATRFTAVLPHWPQPGLVVRDPARGEACENLAYFGRELNLAYELRNPEWSEELAREGMTWRVAHRAQWHDYREIDVSVSVRDFATHGVSDDPVINVDSKPASKLINSWIAGVPAILGREPAYRRARRSPLDYLEVESLADLRAALKRLKSDPGLYRDMVANGRMRAADFTTDAVARFWHQVFLTQVREQYDLWSRRSYLARLGGAYRRAAHYFSNPKRLANIWRALRK